MGCGSQATRMVGQRPFAHEQDSLPSSLSLPLFVRLRALPQPPRVHAVGVTDSSCAQLFAARVQAVIDYTYLMYTQTITASSLYGSPEPYQCTLPQVVLLRCPPSHQKILRINLCSVRGISDFHREKGRSRPFPSSTFDTGIVHSTAVEQ